VTLPLGCRATCKNRWARKTWGSPDRFSRGAIAPLGKETNFQTRFANGRNWSFVADLGEATCVDWVLSSSLSQPTMLSFFVHEQADLAHGKVAEGAARRAVGEVAIGARPTNTNPKRKSVSEGADAASSPR
jgi:hypothetical protein